MWFLPFLNAFHGTFDRIRVCRIKSESFFAFESICVDMLRMSHEPFIYTECVWALRSDIIAGWEEYTLIGKL